MDDTTRGLGGDRDDITGRGDETTRNRESTGTTTGSTRVPTSRTGAGTSSGTTGRTRTAKTTAGTTTTPDDTGLDAETDRRTRQIQAEIADTREELSETIDALQEKLRPANIVSDATEKVKTATTERVRHMAESAGETAQDMMRNTRDMTSGIVEGARQNPIPALMIGIGVAWLLVDRTRNNQGNGWRQRSVGRSQDWRRYGSAGDYDRSYRSGYGASGTAGTLDDEAGYGYSEYGSDYAYSRRGQTSGGSMQRVTERASEMADSARTTLRRSTREAQNGLQRLLRDNPLLVGAAAIVAGAAVGAALPETERENELMGETRDSMVDKAQDLARNAANVVPEAASEAVKDAVKTVTDRVTSGDTPQR